MDLKSVFRTVIKIFLPLTLGCLLLWFLYRNMDITEIWNVIKSGVDYRIILFSLLFGLGANLVRGFRWGLLIQSLGEKFKMRNAVYAVLGNYAVNLVLPRVGEVWRCGMVTKYDRKNPELIDGFRSMFNSIWIYAFAVFFIFGIWFVFKYLSNFTLVQKAKGMLHNIWTGIKSVWVMDRKGLFLIQTLLIWVGYFFYFYITFYAFDFTRDLGISVGLIAFTMSSIGVAVPVQGGIGPWHFMVIATLTCFGVNENDAAAFALVVHTLQTAWTGICGLVGVAALPILNRKTNSKTTL